MTRGGIPEGALALFDVAAEGELFDCRPFEVARPAYVAPDLTPGSWRCPSCGEGNEVSPGAICPRCERAGHEALTMEVE